MVKTLHLPDKESRCFTAVQAFDLTQNLDMSAGTPRFPGKNRGKRARGSYCISPLPVPVASAFRKKRSKTSRQKPAKKPGKKKPSSKM
jgi:hypothetical protein